jgi:hypothetical protein
MPARIRHQLAIQIDPALLARVKAAAADRQTTTTALVVGLIEAGLDGGLGMPRQDPGTCLGVPSPGLDARVTALEAAVQALQGQPRQVETALPEAPPIPDGDAITTAELAARLGVSRGSLNNWVCQHQPGDVRSGWRLLARQPSPVGGPARWLWEPA